MSGRFGVRSIVVVCAILMALPAWAQYPVYTNRPEQIGTLEIRDQFTELPAEGLCAKTGPLVVPEGNGRVMVYGACGDVVGGESCQTQHIDSPTSPMTDFSGFAFNSPLVPSKMYCDVNGGTDMPIRLYRATETTWADVGDSVASLVCTAAGVQITSGFSATPSSNFGIEITGATGVSTLLRVTVCP